MSKFISAIIFTIFISLISAQNQPNDGSKGFLAIMDLGAPILAESVFESNLVFESLSIGEGETHKQAEEGKLESEEGKLLTEKGEVTESPIEETKSLEVAIAVEVPSVVVIISDGGLEEDKGPKIEGDSLIDSMFLMGGDDDNEEASFH